MDIKKEALKLHRQWKGKIEVKNTVEVNNSRDLSLAYTPGVAEPCLAIKDDVNLSYEYTLMCRTRKRQRKYETI
jgi:malate dehydrogenase (oxaloacetate-decarboxylating)